MENKSTDVKRMEELIMLDSKKDWLRLDAQFFSGGNDPEDDPAVDPEVDPKADPEDDPSKSTLTQEEANKIIQKRLAEEQAKFEKERQKIKEETKLRIEKEKKEAAELAKLSEEERQKVEAEKREMEIQKREEEIERKELEFQRKQLEMDTHDVLIDRKLPVAFAPFVLGDDSESTLDNIVSFQDEWQKALETEVNKRLANDPPKVGTKGSGTYNPWKKESFNLTEQGRILQDNPDLAQKLKAQA